MSEQHKFGNRSKENLSTCHPTLVTLANRALRLSPYDFSIIHGWRGRIIQDTLYETGMSKTPWPDSKHNHMINDEPHSLALDFGPWIDGKVPWKETHIFAVIAGCFFAAASEIGVKIRWGGDWDNDGKTTDHTLFDPGHVELVL